MREKSDTETLGFAKLTKDKQTKKDNNNNYYYSKATNVTVRGYQGSYSASWATWATNRKRGGDAAPFGDRKPGLS